MHKLVLAGLFHALLLGVSPDLCHAQKRGNFEFYEAAPEKHLNQKVSIYIMSVDVPAVNAASLDEDFRIFNVYTSSQDGSDTSYAKVKILKSKADMFVKRYNQSQGNGMRAFTPRNATGVFMPGEPGDPYLSGLYYLDMMSELGK